MAEALPLADTVDERLPLSLGPVDRVPDRSGLRLRSAESAAAG